MVEELDVNELVKVEKLPQLLTQLETIGKWVDDSLKQLDLDNLVCSDDNKKDIKNVRTGVNNLLNRLEQRRKDIKEEILKPYEEFNDKYETEIKEKLSNASELLGTKINEIESKQKEKKKNILIEFFKQWQEYYHLEEIISFEDIGLNITLNASETSLKKQIKEFCEKISEDLVAISSNEFRDAILMEYQHNGFNYSKAVITINEQLKKLEEIKEKLEQKENIEKQEQIVVENIDTLISTPKEIIEEEEIEVEFKVITTKSKIIALKEYMKKEGIKYA